MSSRNFQSLERYGATGKVTAINTTSTAAAAFGGSGGYYVFDAIGCNVFVKIGDSTVGAAAATAGNFDIVIQSGTARVILIPDSDTYFRAIADSGSGSLVTGRVGY